MDYASSYAMGITSSHGRTDQVLPPPKPDRLHWSNLIFGIGMVVLVLALVATIAGVPGRMGYDLDGAPNRNKPSSNDPLAISRSIDGNMKWIDANSADTPQSYVGLIKQINRNEAAIPAMAQALASMDASVRAIDSGLGQMGSTTETMGENIAAMVDTSRASGATMSGLSGDIGFLSRTMLELAGATQKLTLRMSSIERQASAIANDGTSAALKSSQSMNATLPDEIPVPSTSGGRAQAAGGGVAFK